MQLVDEYLERFRRGDCEAAFFGLLEAGPESLPTLIDAFQDEPDSAVREFLVEVI